MKKQERQLSSQPPPCDFSSRHLHDVAYYFTKGSELIEQVDTTTLDPILANIVKKMMPLTKQIKPHARRLWAHLEQ